MTDRYGVIGHPVAHSRSPGIHQAFAARTGGSIRYDRIDCTPDEFAATVADFFAGGGRGLNVTVPHKEAAFDLVDRTSMRARVAGAVNTIVPEADGRLTGDNTDGAGLLRDLGDNLGIALTGSRILVLGAGGAARGIVAPLLGQNPRELTLANRTGRRARELADASRGFGSVTDCALDSLRAGFDLVINATAAGLDGEVPEIAAGIVADTVCYDLLYGPGGRTPFVDWCREHDAAAAHDGWGMLVEQAAESFYLWRGDWPQTGPVIASRFD